MSPPPPPGNYVITDKAILGILQLLVKHESHCCWITNKFAERVTEGMLTHADVGLEGVSVPASSDKIPKFRHNLLKKLYHTKKPQRVLLVVVGRQNAGKTTLLWRLHNTDPDTPMNKDIKSTNGLRIGTA